MNSLKNLMLCVCISALTGCMYIDDTITRLWNGGPYMSDKERSAHRACYDEREAALPDISRTIEVEKKKVSGEDYGKYIDYLNACLKRQGHGH